jgi:hypothetical protein
LSAETAFAPRAGESASAKRGRLLIGMADVVSDV